MNYPGRRSLRLFKKADGESEDLFTTDFNFVPEVWYRFKIVMNGNNI